MKLLPTLTAVCTCLTAYTSVALAAETAADTATASVDPAVSGILPGEKSETATTAASDVEVSGSSHSAEKGREAKNAIYLDLAGPGIVYSLNYDREIFPDVAARIGISYLSVGASSGDGSAEVGFSYLAIPITASYLGLGSRNNIFEVGGGGVIMNVKGDGLIETDEGDVGGEVSATVFTLTALAGYRHQPADGGFVFRVGLSPMIALGGNFLPWAYTSFGAAF